MTKPHLYIHTPTAVFKARVNITTSLTYPLTDIPYNNVTLGAYTDIEPDMTLLVGTYEGGDDLGRVRTRYLADADSVSIPRTSRGIEDGTLDIQDNAYITVLEDWRPWAKIPYFDVDNGVDYKDGDIEVGTYNTDIPPVANCGPGFADYIDSGTSVITVDFDASLSFPVADGATISTYAWDVKDGTITVGTSADEQITATFPAGFRWVALTVTDSNGEPHTARCPVLAVDPDADVTVQGYQLNQRLEKSGQTLDIELLPHLDRDTYLDGTLVMFWLDAPSSASDRSHMKFIGWLDTENESIGRNREGLERRTSLKALDLNGKLDKLPGFPQALYREEEEDEETNPALPWGYMPTLDMHKALVYLLFWHSTALELGDFILPSGLQSYDAMRLDSGAGTLFSQVNQQAQKIVPDHYFTCNTKGQMQIQRDWMLDDVGDRPTAAPIITEAGWNDLSFEYNRHPKIHVLRSGAIGVSTDWIDDGQGNDTLPTFFSIAPGDSAAFSQGTNEATENEGLTLTQADLNKSEGHRYARLNSRFGLFSFSDPTVSDFWDYEPAEFNRVQFNIGADYATKRGLSFLQMVGQIQSIGVSYRADEKGLVMRVDVQFEKEVEGHPALSTYPDDTVDPGDPVLPGTVPPDMGLTPTQELVAGIGDDGYVYRTSDFQTASGSGGPTWDRVNLSITGPIFSWVVDPFSPGYILGSGTINGWVVNETDIYRVEDLFGTPSATSVHTFATAVDADLGHWRTIQASFGRYFDEGVNPWLLCISYYGATSGHTGTYALRSVDGGITWSGETTVSEHYDTSDSESKPIAIYASPKTPGFAYCAAYYETDAPARAVGYTSGDWGETWTALAIGTIPDAYDPNWGITGQNYPPGVTMLGKGYVVAQAHSLAEGSETQLVLPYPASTVKRFRVEGTYQVSVADMGTGSTAASATVYHERNAGSTLVSSFAGNPPRVSVSDVENTVNLASGTFWAEWTKVNPWPAEGNNYGTGLEANCISVSLEWDCNAYIGGRITEIELDDSTVYTLTGKIDPENGHAGAIHLPWPDNDDESIIYYGAIERITNRVFKLKQASGDTSTDISPTDGERSYGVNHYGFSIRTYDNDRQYAALAGIGNGESTNVADDKVGLWVSSNAGAAWTNILSPVAATEALYGLQIAFSGTDPDVLYTWGGYSDGSIPAISFSSDFGATLDSREGNINSLGTVAFIGIAGGPTA